ncbi:MAG: ceramidase domain-containing protein [Gemmobacter sp.]
MDWLAAVDGYCERTGPEYWAEPVNALTNLAFLVAAAVMWRRVRGMALGQAMVVVLALIGVGSWAFHTHANRLTGLMDVTPIAAFILLYVFAASRDFLRLRPFAAALVAAGFVPFAVALTPLFEALPFFHVSAFYWPVPVLILVFALLLVRQAPATARGLAVGAGVLVVSLAFRSVDQTLCAQLPLGTHFLWHVLNGVMLGWMIEVWRRHVLLAKMSR